MIDRNLLKYPEQLAARLTQMENDINTVKRRGGKVIANGGGGGGSDITVVQTTGTSTTKVMSQNAVTVALGDKVDKVSGKGLSSNDYTTADKNKLADIEAGAQVNDIEVIKKNGTALPISSKTVDIAVPTKTSDLTNDAGFITSSYHDSTKQNLIADALLTAGTQSTNKTVNTYSINTPSLIPSSSTSGQKTTAFDMATTSTAGMMSGTDKTNLDNTVSYIPSQASSTNQLADKDFVNSSINSVTAYYITKNASGDQFNTKAELDNATVFYSGGEVRVPTRNDYCVVLEDESKRDPDSGQDPTTRYIYQNGQWEYQYTINATAFTAAQLAALNSGITSVKVTKLNGIENGAQINVLEGVQLNGVDQTVTNKKVNIPVANDSNIGVSKLYSYTGHSNDGSMDQNTVTTTFIQSEDPVSIPTIADVSTSRIVEGAVTTSKLANNAVTTGKILMQGIFDAIYPVGAIYMSVNNTNPSTLFGGTWVAWGAGKVPVGVNSSETEFNTVEKTGGEKTHTLTTNEMPAHNHPYQYTVTGSGGGVNNIYGFGYIASANGTLITTDGVPPTTGELRFGTKNRGGDQAHNNLQPYITCYMWKRTA